MKAILYGSPLCPDCVKANADISAASLGAKVDYRSITESLGYLKEFLGLRENPAFAAAKNKGQIGIPAFVLEDGSITLETDEALAALAAE